MTDGDDLGIVYGSGKLPHYSCENPGSKCGMLDFQGLDTEVFFCKCNDWKLDYPLVI